MSSFDWKIYLAKYPDLVLSGVTEEWQAIRHYNRFGKKEGRNCEIIVPEPDAYTSEPEPEVVTEPEREVEPEVEPEVVAEVEPEPGPEVVAEVVPEPEPEVEPELDAYTSEPEEEESEYESESETE
jgi:hypothetical protein